jgi:hypothetical protein
MSALQKDENWVGKTADLWDDPKAVKSVGMRDKMCTMLSHTM